MNSTFRAAALGAGALVLLLGSASASSPARHGASSRGLDLTAAAHPSGAEPTVTDTAFRASSAWGHSVSADASALSSAICDGCHGDATTLQVLSVHGAEDVAVDNAAIAWAAQCADCGGTSLSVQVVVLVDGRRVTANNRALAVGAVCEGCNTRALAYQLVVVSPGHPQLSDGAYRSLRAWVSRQSAALRRYPALTPRTSRPARAERRAAATLERLVNGDLDSRTRKLTIRRD